MKPLPILALCGALTLLPLLAQSAHARTISRGRSSDMFYDRGYIYDRPRVPSDRYRGSDMLKAAPPIFSPNADMFKSKHKTNTYGREDMFPRLTVRQIPYHTLVIDPPQGPYNVR